MYERSVLLSPLSDVRQKYEQRSRLPLSAYATFTTLEALISSHPCTAHAPSGDFRL